MPQQHHTSSSSSIPSLSDTAGVAKVLSSTTRGRFLATLSTTSAGDPGGSTSNVTLVRSTSLLPSPGIGSNDRSGRRPTRKLFVNSTSSTLLSDGSTSPAITCVSCLDWNDHNFNRSVESRQLLSRWLSLSLGSASSLPSSSSVVGELGMDGESVRMIDSGRSSTITSASPAALVAVTDGTTVTVHLVSDDGGEEEGVSTVVAVTREKRMESSKAIDTENEGGGGGSAICALSFLPFSKATGDDRNVNKQDENRNEGPIRLAALTKVGELILLEASETMSSIAKRSAVLDNSEPAELQYMATLSLSSLRESDSSDFGATGALAVGTAGNSRTYVAVGIDCGVIVFRPPSLVRPSEDLEWVKVAAINLPSAAISLAFSVAGSYARGYGDSPMLLCAGQADGEIALLDATAPSGLDEKDGTGGLPAFQPFFFIEGIQPMSLPNGDDLTPITSVACHRDCTKQGAGRLLIAASSGSVLRIVDGSAFETFYQRDFLSKISAVAFVVDRAGCPRVVVAKDNGVVDLVGMKCWRLLLEGSDFLKLHEKFHPASVPSPFLRRSSTGKLYNEESVSAVQWACGERLYDASGNKVHIYDSSTWVESPPHSSAVAPSSAVTFGRGERDVVVGLASSGDGKFLAAAVNKEDGGCQLCIYKRDGGHVMRPESCEFPSTVTALQFSQPDSKHICVATCYMCAVYAINDDKGISNEVKRFDTGRDVAAWSKDGKYLAIGAWSRVLIVDPMREYSEICSLDLGGECHVTALDFDLKSSTLVIGRSDKSIAVAVFQADDPDTWQIEKTVCHGTEVNFVEYSPSSPYFLVLGIDQECHVYSTFSLCVVQVIKGEGLIQAASFHPSGSMLALAGETAKTSEMLRGDLLLVRVGEVLNPSWYPLVSHEEEFCAKNVCNKLNSLCSVDRAQLLYHNATEQVFPLAYRIKSALEEERRQNRRAVLGSTRLGTLPYREEVTTFLNEVFREFPRAVFATRGQKGKSIFELAIDADDPRLLKLIFITALVNCRAHSYLIMNDDFRSGFLTKLLALACERYPDVAKDIINSMVLWNCPTLELLDTWKVKGGEPVYNVCPSPAAEGVFDESMQLAEYGALSRPMVLPLSLCSLPFLSAITSNGPVEVFDQEELGIILDEIWFNSARKIFLLDFSAYVLFFICWSGLVITTAKDAHGEDGTCTWVDLHGSSFALWITVFSLNVAFGVKELRQLRSSSDDLLASIWTTMEGAGAAILEQGTNFLETKNRFQKWAGVSHKIGRHIDDAWNGVDLLSFSMVNVTLAVLSWRGHWSVECSVITSFMLLLKLLSYLRGFDDCGWLLIVLFAQFRGAQGFIVVIGTILLGLAVCFNILLRDNEDFSTYSTALFSMFDVGVLGDFDRGLLKDSRNPALTMALFLILLVVVLLVAMSGFVLVLESALEEVREHEDANRRYQRSRIVIDYLKLLSQPTRDRVLGKRRYLAALVPVETNEDVRHADDAKRQFLRRKRLWRRKDSTIQS